MNPFDMTAHDLDVLKTLASLIGGIGGLLAGAAAFYSRLAAKNSKTAVEQTATTVRTDGALKHRSVAETTDQTYEVGQRVLHTMEEVRGEMVHLNNEPRIHGRRRLPTTEIPRPPAEESTYK